MSEELVFGWHVVEAIVKKSPETLVRVFLQEGRKDRRIQEFVGRLESLGIPHQVVPRKDLDKRVSGAHQGVVAEVGQSRLLDEAGLMTLIEHSQNPLLLLLDGITDPHNLGACLRTADAAGVSAVIVPKDKSAPLSAVARKVACGAAERIPFVRVTNLARCMRGLQEAGVWLIGTAGEAEESVFQADFKGAVGLVMGAEGKGMRRLTREHCDSLVHIPMRGSVESLNVSVATGVCLFEAVRQRLSV